MYKVIIAFNIALFFMFSNWKKLHTFLDLFIMVHAVKKLIAENLGFALKSLSFLESFSSNCQILPKITINSSIWNFETLRWHIYWRWHVFSLGKTEYLTQPIQMKLSEMQLSENFFSPFYCIFEIYTKFWTFCKKIQASERMYFRNYRLQKVWLLKCLKSLVSEHSWTVNMLKGTIHCWNLQESSFINSNAVI